MLSPSTEYITEANRKVDRRSRAKVEILYTDPFVQAGNTFSSSHVNNFGDLDSAVVEDLNDQVFDTIVSTPHKWIINDGAWINNGTFYWSPATIEEAANNQVGWISDQVSDGSGDFSVPPEATVTFLSARSLSLIRIVGEPTIGQYPVDYDVYIYDSTPTELHHEVVTGNTSVESVVDVSTKSITNAKSMKLVVRKWSDADTVSKIVEFFGVISDTFYMDDIVSLDILEEMESDGGSAPIGNISCNELSLELQNIELTRSTGERVINPFFPDNASSYLAGSITPNVKIIAYLGFRLPDLTTEYVKMGSFWTTQWEINEDAFSASIVARDRMELLRNNEFVTNEILENYNLSEIAEYVLNHAKINIPLNDLEWSISSALESYTVEYCWFGKVTYMEALQKIAAACMGRVYMSRDDVVTFESYIADVVSGVPDRTISRNEYFKQTRPINSSGLKNYIAVPVSPLAPEEEAGVVHTSDDISIDSGDSTKTVTVKWGDDAVLEHSWAIKDVDGVTLVKGAEIFYPWGATLTVTKISGTSGTFKIEVSGKRLVNVQYPDEVDYDENSIKLYGKKVYRMHENNLVQSPTTAATIATAMLTSLKDPRRDTMLDLAGNPATEIGDILSIEVYSPDRVYDEFRVMRQQFKFSADGLRCQITGRRTIDYGV